jgi:hypothetical protein
VRENNKERFEMSDKVVLMCKLHEEVGATECAIVEVMYEEHKKLEAKLHEVREIYVGMDGMGFLVQAGQTAKERYLMRIITQMYEEAK